MNTTSTGIAPDQLYGYDMIDSEGNQIGSIDGVWVDDATGQPEFAAVKTGWLFGKNHLVPLENAQIDSSGQTVQLPYSTDQIKNGPSFSTDAELSPSDEQEIYSYFGIQRSTAPSPTGLGEGGPSAASQDMTATGTQTDTFQGSTGTQDLATDQREINVPVSEEELAVGKREVQSGQVRLRKVVHTEQQEVPVELRREEIDVERVPVSESSTVPENAFQEQTIDVPVMQEQPVMEKQAHVTGQVRVSKDVNTETQTVGGEVRREEVEVDDDSGVIDRG